MTNTQVALIVAAIFAVGLFIGQMQSWAQTAQTARTAGSDSMVAVSAASSVSGPAYIVQAGRTPRVWYCGGGTCVKVKVED
jgi:hypothetical protein